MLWSSVLSKVPGSPESAEWEVQESRLSCELVEGICDSPFLGFAHCPLGPKVK